MIAIVIPPYRACGQDAWSRATGPGVRILTLAVLLVALSSTPGCAALKGLTGSVTVGPKQPPVVYATGGGSATLTVIACPRSVEAAAMVHQLLELLINSAASIVTADSESTARFVLNGCPFAEAFTTPTTPSARRTR